MVSPDLDFERIFSEVTLGNKSAFEFCTAFIRWVHLIDDVVDQDKPFEPEHVIKVSLHAATTFAFNAFWQEHKQALLPLVIQGVQAYVDSNRWASRPDFRDRASADVLKAQYQEVFWHVAMICGGYDHMDQITQKYRTYHYDVSA